MNETYRLLAADEPSPIREFRTSGEGGGTSDFFLTADHAGRLIPRRLGTLGVTEALSELLDAPAVLQAYSRLVIDCNRQPGMETSIPVISEHTVVPGNENLGADEREARRREIFAPYHDRIAGLLARRKTAGRRTVLVAMHSFTPVFKGEARAVEIGILYNRDARMAHMMLELLRAEGDLVVGDNAPYAITDTSDYTAPVHAEAQGMPHVEIEIRQDLIAEPAGQQNWARRLARLLPEADRRLRAA